MTVVEFPTPEPSGRRARSVADRLVALAEQRYRFGVATTGELFAVPHTGPTLARLLRGGRTSLRAELADAHLRHTDKVASAAGLADAMLVLEGRAQQADPEDLHLRVAPLGPAPEDGVVIDLGRTDGQLVVVTPNGWRICPARQGLPLFRRSQLTQPLPLPQPGGSINELRALLNVTDESWPLLLSWLVCGLVPAISHPIAFLTGEQGTAKSTATAILAGILDPSAAPTRAAPRDPDDWATAAAGSWVVTLDNLSRIPEWLSDAMCRAATGDALVKRTLYSDTDVTVLQFRRVLIANGIDVGTLRGDLADRMIPIELTPIPDQARRAERELWANYHAARPRILGALLTLLAGVLAALPAARQGMTHRPRMADYAEIVAALDRTTGGDNIAASYEASRAELAATVVETSHVATACQHLLQHRNSQPWHGTAAELLAALPTPQPLPNSWPRTPAALSNQLNRIAPALHAVGLNLTRRRSNGTRIITLSRDEPSGARAQ